MSDETSPPTSTPTPTPTDAAKRKRLIDLIEQGTINAVKKAQRPRARRRR